MTNLRSRIFMKKKVNLMIEENLHKEMKFIALKQGRYVSDLYEEIVKEFIRKSENQLTLDEIK